MRPVRVSPVVMLLLVSHLALGCAFDALEHLVQRDHERPFLTRSRPDPSVATLTLLCHDRSLTLRSPQRLS